MAKKKKAELLIKNKQVKYLPFLIFEKYSLNRIFKLRSSEQRKQDLLLKAQKKAKRKKIINILTFVFNIGLLAGILIWQLSKEGASTIYAPKINWVFIAILAGIFVVTMLIDALKIFILIKRSTGQNRFILSYKVSALGKYYDNITPMATGGQPFQMLYMNKRGIRGDASTGIPLMKYITWQISYVLICVFVLLYNAFKFGSASDPVTTTVAWIAVTINVVIFSTIVLLSFSKRFGPKLVIWILKLLSKMHIIKNYQKTFRKVMRFVVNYQKTFKMLASNPFVLLSEIILAITDIVLGNLIAYFVCRAFVPAATMEALNITIFSMFIKSVICGLTLGFIPTPGSSGGAEAMFLVVFGSVFTSVGQFWPLITWRISTYYIFLLQGLLVLVYDFAIGNKRYEKHKLQVDTEEIQQQPTFKQTLEQNRKIISVVRSQEEDKLPVGAFATGMNFNDNYVESHEEIIKDSQLVSKEEMNEKVYPAEQVLLEIKIKDINRRRQQNDKRKNRITKAKIKRKNNKKNKKAE